MGSRINVSLVDLLTNPNVDVKLLTTELNDGEDNPGGRNSIDTTAEVTFYRLSSKQENLVFSFDYHVHQGRVELSADFNWFRYEEYAPQKQLLKMLYEHSVSFTVHH